MTTIWRTLAALTLLVAAATVTLALTTSFPVVLTVDGALVEIAGVYVLAVDVARAITAPGPIRRGWEGARERVRRAWTGDRGRVVTAPPFTLSARGSLTVEGEVRPPMTTAERLNHHDMLLELNRASIAQVQAATEEARRQAEELRALIEQIPKNIERRSLLDLGELAPRLVLGTLLVVLGTIVSAVSNLV